jgi:hypothetical protein
MKSYRVDGNGDLIDESTGKPYLPLPSAVARAQAAPRERLHEMSESDRQRQQAKSTVTARLCESYRSLGLSTEEAEIAAGMTPSVHTARMIAHPNEPAEQHITPLAPIRDPLGEESRFANAARGGHGEQARVVAVGIVARHNPKRTRSSAYSRVRWHQDLTFLWR